MSIEIDWVEYAKEGVVRGTNERIKVVDGFPNYFVTTEGRVLSARPTTSPADFDNLIEKKILHSGNRGPYVYLKIDDTGKYKSLTISMLVSQAFDPDWEEPVFEIVEIDWVEYAVEGVIRGTDERIKVVDGFTNYFVTTEGRVFSAKPTVAPADFDNLREKTPVWGGAPAKKYWRVSLLKGETHNTFGIHVLVAKAFIPNPHNLPIVNHLKYPSNRVEDLEWSTQQGNCKHGENSKEHLIQFPDGSIQQIRCLANFIRTFVRPGISMERSNGYAGHFKKRKKPLNGYKFIETLES